MAQQGKIFLFGIVLYFFIRSSLIGSEDVEGESFTQVSFHKLEGNSLQTIAVRSVLQCCMRCERVQECLSFNIAVLPTNNGLYDCVLLKNDKSESSEYLAPTQDYHHYTRLVNKCKDPSPCQNNGKCYPDYVNDDYHCVCNRRWGKNCENYIGIKNSAILLNYGKANYTQTLFDYLDAALMNASSRNWSRCWHAASDGWDTRTTFYLRCNVKNTVTIVRVGSYIFGGFSDTAWDKSKSYMFSNKSFLFSLYNANGPKPIKLNLVHGIEGNAISGSYGNAGPVFGGGNDLSITSKANMNKNSYTKPHTYDTPEGCIRYQHCNIFAGESPFTPSDVEVFAEI